MARDREPSAGGGRRGRESGVALLIVLAVLFIVAVLMVDISLTASTARRSAGNASSEFLMDAAIEGRFHIYASQLLYDMQENQTDSLNDRWAVDEYADPEGDSVEEDPWAVEGEEDEEAARVLGDSAEVTIERTIEDEERKFNLNLLLHPDPKKRADARERFAVLIDRFREDTPFDISRTKADQLRDKVVEYLERAAPVEGEKGKIPVPKSGSWRILTPDELLNVDGFLVDEVDYRAREILYDTRDLDEVRAYEEDPENQEPPEVYHGLLHYLTLWSGTAWAGEANPDSWIRINVNTAEKPVLETLFFRNPSDYVFAERIIEYRETTAEDAEETTTDSGVETTPDKQAFENLEDLKKVDGLDDPVLSRNGIDAAAVTFRSDTFSLDFKAKHNRAYKQVRFIVRRHSKGYTTLLREERADPRFEEDDEEPEEE